VESPPPTQNEKGVSAGKACTNTITMRALIASTLLALPMLGITLPAKAQYFNYNYQQIGQFGYGSVYGYGGSYGTLRQSRIGNFINTSYNDNYGSINCRTSYIGNFIRTSCY
jgi:hypothetical protein